MTAHQKKPTITPERVAWFAAYYREHSAWGVFHVSLSDGNWHCGASDSELRPGTSGYFDGRFVPARYDFGRDEWEPELAEAAAWFDTLTPSQRRRLKDKAERIEHERERAESIARGWDPTRKPSGTFTITYVGEPAFDLSAAGDGSPASRPGDGDRGPIAPPPASRVVVGKTITISYGPRVESKP